MKNTPECGFCIYASSGGGTSVECHKNPPDVDGRWPETYQRDFCGKWRGKNISYKDLFPKVKDE